MRNSERESGRLPHCRTPPRHGDQSGGGQLTAIGGRGRDAAGRVWPLRRLWLASLLAGLLLPLLGGSQPRGSPVLATTLGADHWVTTWAAGMQATAGLGAAPASGQTLRQVVFSSVGGRAVRIVLSNAFGSRPLRVGAGSVGRLETGAAVVPSSLRHLSFSGHAGVVVRPGGEVVSDPVALPLPRLQRLVVSLYLTGAAAVTTGHAESEQTGYLAPGDLVAAAGPARFRRALHSWYCLAAIEVQTPPTVRGTVVAFGDSITDGFHSTTNANARWPNYLARRLLDRPGRGALGVVDEGIGGNRLLHGSSCFGPSGLSRLRADGLSLAGARYLVLLEGINDIGFSQGPQNRCTAPNSAVTAGQIIAGYRAVIGRARAAGVKVIGATLTPFEGSRRWTPGAEAKREAVNRWILSSGAFYGVVNFAAVVAEPGNPLALRPKYDSGDHLHPNDAGYSAMAAAVNLALLG